MKTHTALPCLTSVICGLWGVLSIVKIHVCTKYIIFSFPYHSSINKKNRLKGSYRFGYLSMGAYNQLKTCYLKDDFVVEATSWMNISRSNLDLVEKNQTNNWHACTHVLGVNHKCYMYLIVFSHLSYTDFDSLWNTCREETMSSCCSWFVVCLFIAHTRLGLDSLASLEALETGSCKDKVL